MCVAVNCSKLQECVGVAVCWSVSQYGALSGSVSQFVAVCCSVMQCDAV